MKQATLRPDELLRNRCQQPGSSWKRLLLWALVGMLNSAAVVRSEDPPPLSAVRVRADKTGFETVSGQPFIPWGVNYDRDFKGRLLEDYWIEEWATVESDFAEMRALGFNLVRIHLQTGKFLKSATESNPAALAQLEKLVALAERERLYLDVTGLGCYHKADVPAWYDALNEAERWQAQAVFWQAVVRTIQRSPAVFCYDLMNEPVVPGGRRSDRDWLGPAFGGKHFVQLISLDQADRPRPEIARAWIQTLVKAIREVDREHLITVGLVDWSLDRPGLTSGFLPSVVAADLDFVAVHLYPQSGQLDADLETLRGFQVGKPIVIEETFPLKCNFMEMEQFLQQARGTVVGVVSFYWGQTPEELAKSQEQHAPLIGAWLERFQQLNWSRPPAESP